MNLSKKNYSKHVCRFRRPGKIDIEGTIYTYESKNDMFDVVIIAGQKHYQKNMGGYTDRVETIHRNIEKHYNI